MNDPTLSLAFALHSNKGAYVVFLGSGVSRSAGIPTGWEIVLDLIRKLAHLKKTDCQPDPAAWYACEFGAEADYSNLLAAVAKSPTERSKLLRSYFEPTEEERNQNLKVPTAAHRAIAGLVASAHIRVIITTNFDRLMEKALEEVGIVPTVISSPDAAEGATSITHTTCTIIKVHGDYIDTRIKNSPAELAKYDERIDKLLDRVFDEFELIICGWSAEWDIALLQALERCKSHRYTTYWCARGESGAAAENLIKLRRAEVIPIKDANSFFQNIAEKTESLQEFNRSHPLSAKVAVETVKRYLVDERHRIRLHDLVMREAEKLVAQSGRQ